MAEKYSFCLGLLLQNSSFNLKTIQSQLAVSYHKAANDVMFFEVTGLH